MLMTKLIGMVIKLVVINETRSEVMSNHVKKAVGHDRTPLAPIALDGRLRIARTERDSDCQSRSLYYTVVSDCIADNALLVRLFLDLYIFPVRSPARGPISEAGITLSSFAGIRY
jgi:hypothetical protein